MKFRTISDDYVPSIGESFVPNSSLTDPTQAESLTNLIARFRRGDIRLNSSSGAYYETDEDDVPDDVIDASVMRLNDFTDIDLLSSNNSEIKNQADDRVFGARKAQQKHQSGAPEVKKEVVDDNNNNELES